MQKVFNVAVDIGRKLPAPAFEVNTNDLKSVKLLITITNGQTLLDLTDTTVRIAIRKPDNNIIFQDCTIKDAETGQVEIVLENQAYIMAGTHTAEIMCYKGNDVVAVSGTFSYKSTKGIMNDEAVESKSEFTAINQKIEEAKKLLEDAAESGVGVDEQARQEIQEVTAQLADTSQQMNTKVYSKGRKYDGSLLSFITDDGDEEDKLTMLPIFQRLGVPFCTAVIPKQIGEPGRLTLAEVKELENAGHEIMSHSYSHPRLSDITEEELENEVRLSKEYLDKNKLKAYNFAVPYGAYNDKVKLAIQKYYRSSRISAGYFNTKPLESFELKSVWIENINTVSILSGHPRNSFEHYKYFIDQAVANNYFLIISTHSWEIKDWGYESLLEQIVTYAKSVIPIVTINQALDRLENIMESALFSKEKPYEPHFAVSPDGKINSNMAFYTKLAPGSVSATTPLSNFGNSSVSVCAIPSSKATGFPNNTGGMLETHKFIPVESPTDYGYCYQEYKLYNSENVYKRMAKSDGTWGTFYLIDYRDNKILVKELSGTHKPSDLTQNHITSWGYSNSEAAAASLPEGKAGTLYAFAFGHYSNDNAYYFEFYQLRNSTTRYIRSASSATSWGTWQNPNDPNNQSVIIAASNAYTANSLYSDFPDNKITHCKILTSNATGFPDNVAGMLVTSRLGGTDLAFNYQTYHRYNSNDTFKRFCNASGVWQPWVKYTVV